MVKFWVPDESSGEIRRPGELDAAPTKAGFAHWTARRGARLFPARPESLPQGLDAQALLVAVLENGTDYEYRRVGAGLVAGFGEDFSGRRLSAIVAERPRLGIGLRMLYDMVRSSGEPLGYRGWVGKDMPGALFAYHESAILPFGASETRVDHILVVSVLLALQDAPPAPHAPRVLDVRAP